MERLTRLWEQAKTVARAVPARVIAATAVLVGVADEVAAVLPDDVPETPAALAIQVATVAAAIVGIVRSGTWTWAHPADRGILHPPDDGDHDGPARGGS